MHTVVCVVGVVVGVGADMRFGSPRDPAPPTLYFFSAKAMDDNVDPIAGLRYAGADPRLSTERLRHLWLAFAPAVPFTSITAQSNIAEKYYRADEQRARLFTAGAVLGAVIGAIGLCALAAFYTGRRVCEIGIRKTLGASTAQVLRLLVGAFLRPVLIANLIARPIAFVAMRSWLAGFDQRVDLSPSDFLIATLLAITIAVATTPGQSLRVAGAPLGAERGAPVPPVRGIAPPEVAGAFVAAEIGIVAARGAARSSRLSYRRGQSAIARSITSCESAAG